MKCHNCGTELSDNAVFCKECGCKLLQEPEKLYCRECGSELEEGAKFCSLCGGKVLLQTDIIMVEEDDAEKNVSESDSVEIVEHRKRPLSLRMESLWCGLDWFTRVCIVCGIFFAFALTISWIAHKPMALIATIVQIVSLIAFYLIKSDIIKTDKQWVTIVLTILILVMTSVYVNDFKAQTTVDNNDITAVATIATAMQPSEETVAETTEYILADDEIRIDFSNFGMISQNYEDVEYRLGKLGFTNISYRIKYDIVWGITSEGSVSSVSIAGLTNYSSGDIFKADDPVVITYHMKAEDDPNKIIETVDENETENVTVEETEPKSVSYSTNTADTVKNGDSGVYAYKSIGGKYGVYWIIDFDDGYVYGFTDKTGDSSCARLKIDSGTLNTNVLFTWHETDGDHQWAAFFKWAKQPDHLVIYVNENQQFDYYSTNLSKALLIRSSKNITDG